MFEIGRGFKTRVSIWVSHQGFEVRVSGHGWGFKPGLCFQVSVSKPGFKFQPALFLVVIYSWRMAIPAIDTLSKESLTWSQSLFSISWRYIVAVWHIGESSSASERKVFVHNVCHCVQRNSIHQKYWTYCYSVLVSTQRAILVLVLLWKKVLPSFKPRLGSQISVES